MFSEEEEGEGEDEEKEGRGRRMSEFFSLFHPFMFSEEGRRYFWCVST